MGNMKIDVEKAAQASELLKKSVNTNFADFIAKCKTELANLPENEVKEGVTEAFKGVCKTYNDDMLPLFNDIDADFKSIPEVDAAIKKLGAGVNQVKNVSVTGKAAKLDPSAFSI